MKNEADKGTGAEELTDEQKAQAELEKKNTSTLDKVMEDGRKLIAGDEEPAEGVTPAEGAAPAEGAEDVPPKTKAEKLAEEATEATRVAKEAAAKEATENEAAAKVALVEDEHGFIPADKEDMPEGLSEDASRAFWKSRKATRVEREERAVEKADYEKRLEKPAEAAAAPAAAPAAKEPGVGDLPYDAKVFSARAKAQSIIDGENVEGITVDDARAALKACDSEKSRMTSPENCLAIITMAEKGEFGDLSAAVATDAKADLVVVQQREAQWEKHVEGVKGAITDEFTKSYLKYPDLNDDKSEASVFGMDWMKTKIMATERSAELHNPKNINGLVEEMMGEFKGQATAAAESAEMKTLRDENARLKRDNSAEDAALTGDGSAPAPSGGAGGSVKAGSSGALDKIMIKFGG